MKEISLHILDLVQNSIRAGAADIYVRIKEDTKQDVFSVEIEDNGCGMEPEMVEAVQSPFVTTRTTRKVGLGIPLFAAGCQNCEGSFKLESTLGKGTRLLGSYRRSHLDRPPLGGIADTIALLISANPQTHFCYEHCVDERSYELDTNEIKQILGEVPLDTPDVVSFITEFLKSNEIELMEVNEL